MSSIKCGRCRETHKSVAEVRACFDGKDVPSTAPVVGHDSFPNRYAGPCKLCGSWVLAMAGHIENVNGKWTVFHNSGDCVAKPKTEPAPVDFPDVPAGHYAVKSLTGNNDLTFVRVDKPLQGTWAGATFLKEIVGGHPDSRVRGVKRIRNILQAILDSGPESAALLYAQELGRCSRCNRHLTDEVSRALGIGPVCREPKS